MACFCADRGTARFGAVHHRCLDARRTGVISSEKDSELYDAIRTILDPGFDGAALADEPAWRLAKRTSDADHLIAHSRSRADAFVTLDDSTILVHRDALGLRNVAVCWPSEAVAMVEEA